MTGPDLPRGRPVGSRRWWTRGDGARVGTGGAEGSGGGTRAQGGPGACEGFMRWVVSWKNPRRSVLVPL